VGNEQLSPFGHDWPKSGQLGVIAVRHLQDGEPPGFFSRIVAMRPILVGME
jgi:hypothetical protein